MRKAQLDNEIAEEELRARQIQNAQALEALDARLAMRRLSSTSSIPVNWIRRMSLLRRPLRMLRRSSSSHCAYPGSKRHTHQILKRRRSNQGKVFTLSIAAFRPLRRLIGHVAEW